MKMTGAELFGFFFAALTIGAGCGPHVSSEAGKSDDKARRVQPGSLPTASEDWGSLELSIVRVHENQKPLDRSPWHEAGGDWTFLECETPPPASAHALIGTRTGRSAKADLPVSWSEAMIAVSDPTAGARFVEVFARAFHQPLPASRNDKPRGRVRIQTAVLGRNLKRNPDGGFSGNGSWTATKWFLAEDELGEAEVFFNFSLREQRAEFSEKDEDYREALIGHLAIGLRDGPPPDRSRGAIRP